MKYLLYTILAISLFTACSNDDKDNGEWQDYTSFIVTIDKNIPESITFPNCIVAYKKGDNFLKISDLGDISSKISSKEITLNDNTITDLYIFSDYNNVIRFNAVYKIEKNRKNIIEIKNGTGGIPVTDKTDQTQYPQ